MADVTANGHHRFNLTPWVALILNIMVTVGGYFFFAGRMDARLDAVIERQRDQRADIQRQIDELKAMAARGEAQRAEMAALSAKLDGLTAQVSELKTALQAVISSK